MTDVTSICRNFPLELQELVISYLPENVRLQIGCNVSESSFWSKSLAFSREKLHNVCVYCDKTQSPEELDEILQRYEIVCITGMENLRQITDRRYSVDKQRCKYLYADIQDEVDEWFESEYNLTEVFEKIVIISPYVFLECMNMWTPEPLRLLNMYIRSKVNVSEERFENLDYSHTYSVRDHWVFLDHPKSWRIGNKNYKVRHSIGDVIQEFPMYDVFVVKKGQWHEHNLNLVSIIKTLTPYNCIDDATFLKYIQKR